MRIGMLKLRLLQAASAIVVTIVAVPAPAQTAEDFAAIRAEIQALRDAQAKSDAEIAALKAQLGSQAAQPSAEGGAAPVVKTGQVQPGPQAGGSFVQRSPGSAAYASAAAPVNAAGGSAPGMPPASVPSELTTNGDFRLRRSAQPSAACDAHCRNASQETAARRGAGADAAVRHAGGRGRGSGGRAFLRDHISPSAAPRRFWTGAVAGFVFVYERHSEFITYSFVAPAERSDLFEITRFAPIKPHIDAIPGELIRANHVQLLDADTPVPSAHNWPGILPSTILSPARQRAAKP